ncbi:hypothetical protein FKR81_33720 [Lentzea tibetensis]|uniref:ATP-grasp domain-containing protein n=1 Tax=Lentzea tibetensis TaxID=2591470 RepID=A0A563EJI5_9PSEU|nr:hypothetical protein [Lentzea tibetensis]TWP47010.1 hypothetical protein FKR81_33720 [Lentzea tibetensis]
MRYWLGSFDAERAWRPADLANLPAVPGSGDVSAMDELLAGFCSPDDTLVTRNPLDPVLLESWDEAGLRFRHHSGSHVGFLLDKEIVPYAVTTEVAALSTTRLPAVDAVARVNSKTWSNELVVELGLPGAGVVARSAAAVEQLVSDLDGPAVVKDPYGVSGRGSVEVSSPGVLRAVTRVLARQSKRVELVVQPLFAKRHDLSAHGEVTQDGAWRWLGAQVVRNRGFRYAGSGPLSDGLMAVAEEQGWRQAVLAVAECVAEAGYFGPLSIDAMLLADDTLVPVLEINARYSLGRLSLELDRRFGDGDLRSHLWQVELGVPPGTGVADLVRALASDGLLYRGGPGAGCVVLGGGVVASPSGRVHCALRCRPRDVLGLRDLVLSSFAGAGVLPRGTIHAA